MMPRAIQKLLVRHRRLVGPVRALHYKIWRTTGVSGITALWPELRALAEAARRTPDEDFVTADGGPRVLLFTFRAWNQHVFYDALLAHALRLRGADVRFFTCGGRLPVCDIWAHRLAPPMPCNSCAPYVTTALATLRLPCDEMRDFITSDERGEIERLVAATAPADYERFEFDGLPIGELVRPSVQWFLLTGSREFDEEMKETYRHFLISGAIMARVTGRMLDQVRPNVLYLLNGMFFAERIAIEQARRRGITFITHEGGFFAGSQVFTRNGFAPFYDLDESWPHYAARPLTESEERRLDEQLRERETGRSDAIAYYSNIQSGAAAVAQQLGLDRDRPIVTLFTNVDWDTACFAGGTAFGSMGEWIQQTIRHFKERPDHQLVIRIHPGEVRLPLLEPREPVMEMIRRVFSGLPANIHVIPPESNISSYTLMDLSAVGLVYSSTTGMEMALRGKPVITAGRAYYGGKGFTLDIESREEYDELLNRLETLQPLKQQQLELVRRYATLFFFRHHIPFPPVTSRDGALQLNIDDLSALRPEREPFIDLICDGILKNEPFLYRGAI